MPAQERGCPWSARWNSSSRTRSRSPKWSTISSGDHLPGAIGRVAPATESPWIAAFTAARARASSNSSSSRDVAWARWVANADGVTGAAAGARRTVTGRGATTRGDPPTAGAAGVRLGAVDRFGAVRFTLRFAVRAPDFFFAGARRLAPARDAPERAERALLDGLLRLACFFPAARATRFPRSVSRPRGGRDRFVCPRGVRSPRSGPAHAVRARTPARTLRCDGVRHRRILVHPATALPAQSTRGHVLL